MNDVPPHILEWRRKIGADRWDEVWDGVLHMAPEPTIGHQELELQLAHWLLLHWARAPQFPDGPHSRVLTQVCVSRPGIAKWTLDYRVPDLLLLRADGAQVEHESHFEGGPEVVVEVRSPRDESYDKLPFYAAIGCREIWVIDRDSRACEIYAVVDGEPVRRAADDHGWTASCAGVELRTDRRRLAIRRRGDDATRGLLP